MCTGMQQKVQQYDSHYKNSQRWSSQSDTNMKMKRSPATPLTKKENQLDQKWPSKSENQFCAKEDWNCLPPQRRGEETNKNTADLHDRWEAEWSSRCCCTAVVQLRAKMHHCASLCSIICDASIFCKHKRLERQYYRPGDTQCVARSIMLALNSLCFTKKTDVLTD